MKLLKSFIPLLTAIALFSGALYADEKEDILSRVDRDLLLLMSGFAEAHESTVTSSFRRQYQNALDRFMSDAESLQGFINELDIGEDLNVATHARNILSALQQPIQTETKSSSSSTSSSKNKKPASTAKANDPFSRMTGQSLSELTGGGDSTDSATSAWNRMSAGFSFHMIGNAIQTLSSLGFGLRNGKYSVSPKYRRILPYLELKRDVEYFNASYEHFDSLIDTGVWRSDFEKRLKRMTKLAAKVQPVYNAYFPGKTFTVSTETERLSSVYTRFVEYVKAVEQARKEKDRLSDTTNAFGQIRQSSIPDKGLILRDYDTAASHFAEFFTEMDSVDWTSNPFSNEGPAAKNDAIKLPERAY